jgi:DNA-binding XRE family transcriptional regulator
MTTLQAESHNASIQIGSISSPASKGASIISGEFSATRPLALPNTVPFEDLMAEFHEDAEVQTAFSDALKKLGASLYAGEQQSRSFTALRLRAGLSQEKLAALAATSQPYIARLESGTVDPGTDVVARLAKALGVDEGDAFKAVRYQRETRGKHHER